MNYSKIRKMDISNGPGVRVSIFFQGCTFHCPECFNSEIWDFKGGKEFNDDVINQIIDLCKDDYIEGLSILGGEPMHPKNIDGTLALAKKFKEVYPNKSVWVWTGYKYEDLQKDTLMNIDVLVDGLFEKDLYSPTLKWRGSSNQRVIDVQKTLHQDIITIDQGIIILYCE